MMGKNVPAKKPGQPGQRTIERWVTINGNHVPIFEGETEEDVKKRLDGWNKQGNTKDSYKQFLDNREMTEQFKAVTGIKVNRDVADTLQHEVLADIYDTISDISEQYDCHIKAIGFRSEDESDSVMASMDMAGVLRLNSDYFSDKEYLNATYEACVNQKFHPKAPNGMIGVISHEMGHAILHKKLLDMESKAVQVEHAKPSNEPSDSRMSISLDAKLVDRWLAGQVKDTEVSSLVDTSGGRAMYKEFAGKVAQTQANLMTDARVKQIYGGIPNRGLKGMINPEYGYKGVAISEYAAKNTHEMVAEAFSDVYCNGAEASLASLAVYNIFIKEMKK